MLRVVVAGSVGFAALALVTPDAAAWVSAKEGPLEHLGHVELGLGVLAWSAAAWRARGPGSERWLCLGLALMCAVILGEELDWGGVYGWTPLAAALAGATGRPNLHNAWSGGSYLLFAVPPLLLVGVVGWRRGDAPGRLPRRSDAVSLLVLGAVSLGASLLWEAGEEQVDEVGETLLYLSLLWMAVRPTGADQGASPR